jgi:F-type H+-transporting ATPase subunit gamma
METLEHLRRRLNTTEDLQSVVRTMKALAAVSIRQHEQAARALRVYYRTVELGLHVVLRSAGPLPETLRLPKDAPQAAVVFGSDHGLCGRFNDDIVAHAVEKFALSRTEGAPLRVLVVGARAAMRLEQAGVEVSEVLMVPGAADHITAGVREVLHRIDAWHGAGVERVRLFFNRHIAGSRYEPITQRLMPVDFERFRRLEEEPWPSHVLPTYSMPRPRLLTLLLRQYFFVNLFRACAESLSSEHAARLAAMQAAERSLDDRRTELIAQFRRQRQDLITAELLDVVSGYETLTAPAG